MNIFSVKNLSVSVDSHAIIHDINLELSEGKVAFLLGRNGAGKSTFSQAVMGNSQYNIQSGEILLNNENILELSPEERSKKGLFVSFQHPPEIEGVSLMNFLHNIYIERFGNEDVLSRSTFKFRKHVLSLLERVNLDSEFIDRSLNVGFSGGEKKRSEILQMLLLKPSVVILDEIDSGLDIHAIKILEDAVSEIISNNGIVLYITHNVDFVKKQNSAQVYVLESGKIISSEANALETFINT